MAASSRVTRVFGVLQQLKPTVPSKLKGGRLETLGKYLLSILNDYRLVGVETLQDMKNRPFKAGIYLSILATAGVFFKLNPNRYDYQTALLENANELSLVGEPIRNPTAVHHIESRLWEFKDDKLRYLNLGVCTLIWVARFNSTAELYEAKCSHLDSQWVKFHEDVVDVGVLGHWLNLEKAMEEYDVNPTEWETSTTEDSKT